MAYHGYAAPPLPTGFAAPRPVPPRRPPAAAQRKQRRGQGSLERRREARAAARASAASGSNLSTQAPSFVSQQPNVRQRNIQEQQAAAWPGYRLICEQLGDEDPRNRASAVQTLSLMTRGAPPQRDPWGNVVPQTHRPGAAVRAVVEHDALGRLRALLSQENNPESQIAAADVFSRVVSTSARTEFRPAPHPHRIDSVMREDITAPIVGMLGSDRERVRSSALGAISQLARAGGEARQLMFNEPFLLPRLLDVTECLEDDGPVLQKETDESISVLQLMLDDTPATALKAREAIAARPGVVESIVATATRALPPAEEALLQAQGWSEESSSESHSVSAQKATKALVGLGREGVNAAASALVDVLEQDVEDETTSRLAAMATMRTLVDAEVDDVALSDDDEGGALQAVRDAGGVEKVVELLDDKDEWGQASAALTLQTFVRADDLQDDCLEDEVLEEEEETLRSELAQTDTVQRLVTMLSRGHERPAAAVQAAGAIAALVGREGGVPTSPAENEERSPQKAELRKQLKEAVGDDDSVIQTIVDLLQGVLEDEDSDGTAARDLAETLRSVADGDLSNQLRIRDAGGVRPLMAVVNKEDDDNEDMGKALMRSTEQVQRCRDDIQVRVGLPCREERLYARLVAHPAGFRRWFLLHQLNARAIEREREASEDAVRLKRLARLCRDEKEELLDGLGDGSFAGDASFVVPARLRPLPGGAAPAGSGLVQYELVQSELKDLDDLESRVGLRVALPLVSEDADAANPAAELQLLNTTLAVLGEMA